MGPAVTHPQCYPLRIEALGGEGADGAISSIHIFGQKRNQVGICLRNILHLTTNSGGFYLFVFESACLQHAVMYLLDIPHTISAGILKVCPSGAIYRSSLVPIPHSMNLAGLGCSSL